MIDNQQMVIECFKRGGQRPREERSDTRRAKAVERSWRGAPEERNEILSRCTGAGRANGGKQKPTH